MIATSNSATSSAQEHPASPRSRRRAARTYAPGQAIRQLSSRSAFASRSRGPVWIALLLLTPLLVTWLAGTTGAQTTAAPGEKFLRYYRDLYTENKKRSETETNSVKAAWMFAQACFDWADFSADDTARASIAQEGIASAKRAVALDPQCAPAFHYLGLNLGQFARTKMLGALKLLGEMEVAWKKSIALDPNFKFAGAHRSLGMLYRDAPGWPTSLGDRSKARFHLKKAVELAPAYPDNQIILIETYLGWGEKKNAAPLISGLEKILESARSELTGDDWVLSWGDWQERWKKIKAKTSINTARSPRMTP